MRNYELQYNVTRKRVFLFWNIYHWPSVTVLYVLTDWPATPPWKNCISIMKITCTKCEHLNIFNLILTTWYLTRHVHCASHVSSLLSPLFHIVGIGSPSKIAIHIVRVHSHTSSYHTNTYLHDQNPWKDVITCSGICFVYCTGALPT